MHALALWSLLVVPLAAEAPSSAAPDRLEVDVRMVAGDLVPGQPHAFIVTADAAEGWSAAKAGIPGIFVQLELPPSVELLGKVVETEDDLRKNGLLFAPFERLAAPGSAEIAFKTVRTPEPNETIGVNVVAYLRGGADGDEVAFVRRRLELPVAPNAVARAGDPTRTSWGEGANDERCGFGIGDRADAFELPRADGSLVELAAFRGKKSVLFTTYRAHW